MVETMDIFDIKSSSLSLDKKVAHLEIINLLKDDRTSKHP
jgi:hypothetical protein